MQAWLTSYFNAKPKIAVLGDLMIDAYLWGKSERISPEAPVPVVEIEKETKTLGGAGNVINNLLALGADVEVLGVVGNDEGGAWIRRYLQEKGVSTEGIITQEGRKTSVKTRIISSHHQMLRFDKESKEAITDISVGILEKNLVKVLKTCDALLLSDYKKGVLTDSLTQKAIKLANDQGIPVLVDPKGDDYTKYRGATLLTPNKKEASEATRRVICDEKSLHEAIVFLKETCELTYSIITLSEDGIALYDNNLRKIPTFAQEVYDVTGAGDTVLASLGFALALKRPIDEACRFANAAAAVVVAKLGSATATLDEVMNYDALLHQNRLEIKIKTDEEMALIVKRLKSQHKKIVFTNGCFDILHAGHVSYLQEAKGRGDVLIVGLNADSSVRMLKGESRPIVGENDRAQVLAGLESVDFVVLFCEETPKSLIDMLVPHVLVKGGDYVPENIVGYDTVINNGGEVVVIEFLEGRSTSKIIAKARG